ncbi:MAG: 1-acyl-sn-glycerol-3-phosphate acyltransferase, partial [Bacteroidota bacterium]
MGLYASTQQFIKAGFALFYRNIHIQNQQGVPAKGPVLLVANHPNSFMDALLIGAYLPRPTHFLARGDAFKNRILGSIFKAFRMLPVYRASEGKENMEKNFETFDASFEVINKQECMLIFGEGLSVNNWELRPLKKGPARITKRAWESNGPAQNLVIIPVGLTYSHYEGAGKSVIINYGTPITKADFQDGLNTANFTPWLNGQISAQLNELACFNASLSENREAQRQFKTHWKGAEQNDVKALAAWMTFKCAIAD